MHSVRVPDAQVLDVSSWEKWLADVSGTENLERATQWVNLFRYHRQTQIVSNASAALNEEVDNVDSARPHPVLGNQSVKVGEATTGGCKPDSAKAVCLTDKNTCGNHVVQNCSILPHTAYVTAAGGGPRTQEACAEACARANYSTAGVEYKVACFCGQLADGKKGIGGEELPLSACGGASGMGGADIMLVYPFNCTFPLPPAPPAPDPHQSCPPGTTPKPQPCPNEKGHTFCPSDPTKFQVSPFVRRSARRFATEL